MIARCETVFVKYDEDKDGVISPQEVGSMLRSILGGASNPATDECFVESEIEQFNYFLILHYIIIKTEHNRLFLVLHKQRWSHFTGTMHPSTEAFKVLNRALVESGKKCCELLHRWMKNNFRSCESYIDAK